MGALSADGSVRVDGVDVAFALTGRVGEAELAEAFVLARRDRSCRFFVDGLTELDRTLDLAPGLLDRRSNPRPAFHTLAILNAVRHGAGSVTITRDGDRFLVRRPDLEAVIDLGGDTSQSRPAEAILLGAGVTGRPGADGGPWVALNPLQSPRDRSSTGGTDDRP